MTLIPTIDTIALPLAVRHGITPEDARNAVIWARSMPSTMDYPQEARRAAEGLEGSDAHVIWLAYQQHLLDERHAMMRKAMRQKDWVGAVGLHWTGEVVCIRIGNFIDAKATYHFRDKLGRWLRTLGTLPTIDPGMTVRLRAKVKAHEEYRGAKVTVLIKAEVMKSE